MKATANYPSDGLKPHPTNPRGVLVPCAVCGTELHLPRNDFDVGGVKPERVRCLECGPPR